MSGNYRVIESLFGACYWSRYGIGVLKLVLGLQKNTFNSVHLRRSSPNQRSSPNLVKNTTNRRQSKRKISPVIKIKFSFYFKQRRQYFYLWKMSGIYQVIEKVCLVSYFWTRYAIGALKLVLGLQKIRSIQYTWGDQAQTDDQAQTNDQAQT